MTNSQEIVYELTPMKMWRVVGVRYGRMEDVCMQYPNLKTAHWAAKLLNGRNLGAVWTVEAEFFSLSPRAQSIKLHPSCSQLWISGLPRPCPERELRRWLQVHWNTVISVRFISDDQGQPSGRAVVSVLNEEEATILSITKHKQLWKPHSNRTIDVIVIH
jgi:hypothetical protein